jgi:2-octaprenyl-6-methoxyphenol hydroxylase
MAEPKISTIVRIQGAGPVGILLALFLVKAGWPKSAIQLIDPAINAPLPPHEEDPRVLAISHGTLLRLKQLGIEHNATEIKAIHVSAQGRFGTMEIQNDRVGVSQLGALIGYGNLLTQMRAKAQEIGLIIQAAPDPNETPDVFVIAEGGVYQADHAANNHEANSSPPVIRDYDQRAVIGWVYTSPPPGQMAWERFTEDGAVALLPIKDRYALIWCCNPSRAEAFIDAPDLAQKQMLTEVMKGRVGQITKIAITGDYALGLKWRETLAQGNQVWIGNSAQTLHPIAGQGMNLGFRDAQTLATCLQQHGLPITDRLADYARRRKADRWAVRTATDTLARKGWVRHAIGGVAMIPGAKKLLGQVLMYGG